MTGCLIMLQTTEMISLLRGARERNTRAPFGEDVIFPFHNEKGTPPQKSILNGKPSAQSY